MFFQKKKFMDFSQYSTYKNCFINDEANAWIGKGKFISHYMPLLRMEEWLNESEMTFVSPEKWDDPFEKIYLGTNLKNLPRHGGYIPASIASLCFTKYSFKNSVAFWKVFKNKEQTQLVRVVFNFKKLIAQIIDSLEKQGIDAKVYIAAVDYTLQQEDIKNKQTFVKHAIRTSHNKKMDAELLYIKMLSYKRKAFAFEEEIRIILVPENENFCFDEKRCLKIKDVDYRNIVEEMWLEPIPLPPEWITIDFAKEKMQKLGDRIHQSQLYETQKACRSIDVQKLINKGRG